MVFQKIATLCAAACFLTPIVANAQAMTADEILALLKAQRELLANSDTGEGGTRALGFVINSNPAVDGSGVAIGTEVDGDLITASTDGVIVPEELVIDLTIFFEYDSALLKSESREQVNALCVAIQSSEETSLEMAAMAEMAPDAADVNAAALNQIAQSSSGAYQIIGHTDASGSVQYNLTLSQARADEVVRYMVRECGIDANLLEAVGMGEGRLKDSSNPSADANRRVEIQVTL
ncbi:MAG: OmpA family protein [Rhodobacteraceae bacterium]|nr:OmpA family protein [Paracoccaceae bacterium]